MNKKFHFCLFIVALFISLITIGCTEETENTISEEKGEKLENEITSLEKKLEEKERKIDDYATFLEKTLENLNEEEIKEVAKKRYQYKLKIGTLDTSNLEEIPSDGRMETDLKDFSVKITERMRDIPPDLSDFIIEKFMEGRIDNPPEEWLVVKTNDIDYKHGKGSGVSGHSFWLTFEEIERGTTLEIEVDSKIKERIGLETDVLEIVVKE